MAWKGDPSNPAPNYSPQHEGDNRGTELASINRAEQVRRDTDTQKDFSVKLIDIDTTILKQLERFDLQVVDDGSKIKVPIHYASPEKWKSIQKDGVMRDYNGKLILPGVVFKRTGSEKDNTRITFNRYLRYSVMKKYSTKNRYTPFNVLLGKNVPVNEVYNVVMPDHMVFTYQFIVWTEYVEQMNTIVEKINFETEDYWGEPQGFRFRTKIDSYAHTIDLPVDNDRVVKTEFTLTVNGYLLPDSYNTMQGPRMTTEKMLTPKKIVIGTEVVTKDFDFTKVGEGNSEKIRNPNYPNLPKDEVIPPPPIVPDPNSDLK